MKAAFIRQTGAPDVIEYGDLPTPEPGPTEVLVKVGAVSVNPIDTYIRAGAVAMASRFPYIIGCDLAGTVVKVGTEVKRFAIGDRVWGSNQGLFGRQGTFADFAAVDERSGSAAGGHSRRRRYRYRGHDGGHLPTLPPRLPRRVPSRVAARRARHGAKRFDQRGRRR